MGVGEKDSKGQREITKSVSTGNTLDSRVVRVDYEPGSFSIACRMAS